MTMDVRRAVLRHLGSQADPRFGRSYLVSSIRQEAACGDTDVWEALWSLVGDGLVYLDTAGRNVMREYSEEYLGNPEHDGDGPPIDYENNDPFRSLDAARRAGKIRVWCLGVGIDALNYVGDVLTVAVFDDDVFDEVFDGMVTQNDEGELASDQDRREFTFDRETIERLLATEPFAPSDAACLRLALQHQASLVS